MKFVRFFFLSAVLFALAGMSVQAGQPFETETARLLPAGEFQLETAFEYQTSRKQGQEYATPVALEYGVTDRVQLLLEPVLYTGIRPKGGTRADGIGDVELTAFGLLLREKKWFPALALAGEVKIPTANNKQIGTGKTDVTPFLIASKKFGCLDISANFGYTINGQPSGAHLKNTFNYALMFEYEVTERWHVGVEGLYTTSTISQMRNIAAGESIGGESVRTPEAAGREIVGTIGASYKISKKWDVSLGISRDNNHATLIRPGFTFHF
jgi:hypothetical protein